MHDPDQVPKIYSQPAPTQEKPQSQSFSMAMPTDASSMFAIKAEQQPPPPLFSKEIPPQSTSHEVTPQEPTLNPPSSSSWIAVAEPSLDKDIPYQAPPPIKKAGPQQLEGPSLLPTPAVESMAGSNFERTLATEESKESEQNSATKENEPSYRPVSSANLDWRMFALIQNAPDNATDRLMLTPFASETEKHMALQVSAIINGDISRLDEWHWRTWRLAEDFGYPLSSTLRMFEANDLPTMTGPVYRLMMKLTPMISTLIRPRINIESVIRKRNPTSSMNMTRLSADHPSLIRTGLRYFTEKLSADGFNFIDTPDLGSEVFVDAWSHLIHFSSAYCMTKPPGYLLHRVRFQTFAINSGFFPLIKSDAQSDVMPLVEYLRKTKAQAAIEKIRSGFSAESNRMNKLFQGSDLRKLISLQAAAEPVRPSSIAKLQQELQLHNFRIQLAGTLDLIGLFEAISGDDLTSLSRAQIRTKLEKSPILRDLMMYATKLRF
jgi:hypothetical protein